MSFFKSIFKKKDKPVNNNAEFWNWFQDHKDEFYNVIKSQNNVEKEFLDKITPKLKGLREGYWFLAGMYDENTAELIISADGIIKEIPFVEDLVHNAPKMTSWKITALKQPTKDNHYHIEMGGYKFDKHKMNFFATHHETMPDEIDITVTHDDYNEENKDLITNGVYIALDNGIGELNFATIIDNLKVEHPGQTSEELIPITKLKDYLTWRESEFIEKYKGNRLNTEQDNYSAMEGILNNGLPLVAIVNTDILNWDLKASHPWVVILKIGYKGNDENGMPNSEDYQVLNEIEDQILEELKDSEGYLNIGRQTADSDREVYFTCQDFRLPAKVLDRIVGQYGNRFNFDYSIYKDKYWQTFNRFMQE